MEKPYQMVEQTNTTGLLVWGTENTAPLLWDSCPNASSKSNQEKTSDKTQLMELPRSNWPALSEKHCEDQEMQEKAEEGPRSKTMKRNMNTEFTVRPGRSWTM